MIHDIDLIQSLVGAPIESIDAVGASVFSAGLDIANARIRYANGCVANTTASRVSMKMERKLRLFQDDAYVSIDLQQKVLTIVRKPPARRAAAPGQVVDRGAQLRAGRRAQARDRGVPARRSARARRRRCPARTACARSRRRSASPNWSRAGRPSHEARALRRPRLPPRDHDRGPAARRASQAAELQLRVRRGRRGGRGRAAAQPRRLRAHRLAAAHAGRRRRAGPRRREILGETCHLPLVIAPTGFNGMLWPQGDLALARAAADAGIPFTLSTVSNYPLAKLTAEVAAAHLVPAVSVQGPEASSTGWSTVRSEAGCGTLVVTTDVPVLGAREWDQRNYRAPMKLSLREHARRAGAPGLAAAGDDSARRAAVREPEGVPAARRAVGARRRALHGHADQSASSAGRTWSACAAAGRASWC